VTFNLGAIAAALANGRDQGRIQWLIYGPGGGATTARAVKRAAGLSGAGIPESRQVLQKGNSGHFCTIVALPWGAFAHG
jgi:hypothetical protein